MASFDEFVHPKIELFLHCGVEEIKKRIQHKLEQPTNPFIGSVLRKHIMLKVKPESSHYWSPVLNVDLFEEKQGTLIKGTFGPHPNIWGMFVALYSVIGMIAILSIMFGLSQLMAEQAASGFMGIILCLMLAGAVFTFGLQGKKLARAQMIQMKQFFGHSVTTDLRLKDMFYYDEQGTDFKALLFIDAQQFIEDFKSCELPREEWTHQAHLIVALFFLTHHYEDVYESLKAAIIKYNEATDTPNTDTSGYHVTLTYFWIQEVDTFLEKCPKREFNEDNIIRILASELCQSAYFLKFYSRECLWSLKARKEWVPPDLLDYDYHLTF